MAYLDDYEDEGKSGRKVPTRIIVFVLAGLIVLGIALFAVIDAQRRPESAPEASSEPVTNVTIASGDDEGEETVTETPADAPSETSQREVPPQPEPDNEVSDDPSAGSGTGDETDKPEYKSSAIPLEQKMPPAESSIGQSTESKYAQYGALNIDRMTDVAKKWTREWASMVNDLQWEEHSTVLKAMMDQDYVRNHSTEYEVRWLSQCLDNSLYVSGESLMLEDVAEVSVVNSVPSPLAYMTVVVNATQDRTIYGEPAYETTIRYKMAVNKDYQVCRFARAI